MDHITWDGICGYGDILYAISDMAEDTIIKIFKQENDTPVTMGYLNEIYNKEYVPGLPVWCTMIFRYRNNGRLPCLLYSGGCDLINQARFRRYFCTDKKIVVFGKRDYFGQLLSFLKKWDT